LKKNFNRRKGYMQEAQICSKVALYKRPPIARSKFTIITNAKNPITAVIKKQRIIINK